MNGLLWVESPLAPWSFLAVTVVLGGLAAFASGRALAATWRPFWQATAAMALLAMAVGFMHYALFEESAIPLFAIGEALALLTDAPAESLFALAASLRYFAVIYIVLLSVAAFAYRLTRARAMERQYGFAIRRRGLLSWSDRV